MTQNKMARPAMTAIAAVNALSTPSFAQTMGEADAVTSSPAIETTPAPVVADTLAPVPVADPLAAETPAKPAARKAATAKAATARRRPAPARTASAVPVAVPAAPGEAAAAAQLEPQPVQAEAAPVPAPIAAPAPIADSSIDPIIPVAAIAGLGLVALVGGGLIVRRRRRRAEDADAALRQQVAGTEPDADGEPTMIAEPEPELATAPQPEPELVTPEMEAQSEAVEAAVIAAHEPSPEIDGPVTELPEGFDTSEFGLHVQAAYNGPTEDNPSLSLKNRLSRANGMDQLAEREAEAEVAAAADEELAIEPASAADGNRLAAGGAAKKPSVLADQPAGT
jgi:hypothetical protein